MGVKFNCEAEPTEGSKCAELRSALAAMESSLPPPPPGHRFRTMWGFVATHGVPFTFEPLPAHVPLGVPRHCYSNAHWQCRSARSPWLYCEGYALPAMVGFPTSHAWIVNRRTGVAHDVTWKEPPAAALGLIFHPAYRRLAYKAAEAAGGDTIALIDAWTTRWPLMRMTAEQVANVTINPQELK